MVEVRRDLGVVGGHVSERVRGKALAEFGGQRAHLAQLGDQLFVMRRRRNRRDGRVIARRRADQGRPANVDQLDCLVEGHGALADLRGERLDVDHNEVNQLDAARRQLLELIGHSAVSEDAGVDIRVERLDLSTGEGL